MISASASPRMAGLAFQIAALAGIGLFLAASSPAQNAQPQNAPQGIPRNGPYNSMPSSMDGQTRPSNMPPGFGHPHSNLRIGGLPPLPGRPPAPANANQIVTPAPGSQAIPPAAAPPTTQTVAQSTSIHAGPTIPPHIEWRNGQLSVSAEDYPLSQIIQRVARLADVDISGLDRVTGRASMDFSSQPLTQGFETMLPGLDYAFTQPQPSLGHRGQLLILSRGGAVPDLPKPAAAAPSPDKSAKDAGDDDWSDDTPEQQAAITSLQKAAAKGDQKALKDAVLSNDTTIQEAAFNLLHKIDPQTAIDALMPATASSSPQVVVSAIALLQRSGADPDTILNVLGNAMESSSASVKAYAIQSMPSYGQDSLRYLVRAMSDPDRSTRFAALQASARYPWALPVIQQASTDSDEQIRNLAAQFMQQQNPQQNTGQAQSGQTQGNIQSVQQQPQQGIQQAPEQQVAGAAQPDASDDDALTDDSSDDSDDSSP